MKDLSFSQIMKILFLFCTFVGLANTMTLVTSELAENRDFLTFYPFLYEMTGAYTFYCLTPLLLFIFTHWPLNMKNWKTRVPLYILLSIPFGILHTLLMWGSRTWIHNILNMEPYQYGVMSYRFIMEYTKQFTIFWFFFGVVKGYTYLRETEKEKRRRFELEKQLTEARLNTLKKQINPHFLFNTLNAISSTMYTDVEKADKMLVTLSDLLRHTLQKENSHFVLLEEELLFTQKYVDLIKGRFGEKLSFSSSCPDKLLSFPVPFLMLQPLIENSIKHGLEATGKPIKVELKIEPRGTGIIIHLNDNGPGISETQNGLNEGIGLSNIRERLNQLYSESHAFTINNRNREGFHVSIELNSTGEIL